MRQQGHSERAADHRGGLRDRPGGAQTFEPAPQQILQRGRQCRLGERAGSTQPVRFHHRACKLVDEQRNPVGARHNRRQLRLRQTGGTLDGRGERARMARAQPVERQAGQRIRVRPRWPELRAAGHDHEQFNAVELAGERGKQVARRGVDPVRVLDQKHGWLPGRGQP